MKDIFSLSRGWDLISLGEVMLRLDPGPGRIRTARNFEVWEGGGEYNVARGLRTCFGLRTAIATALVDNPIGRLVENLMLEGGVDTSLVKWLEFDGVGRAARNGLNFTERGFGARSAVGVSDRGMTAASQLTPGDFDWDSLFQKENRTKENRTKYLHTGGIFAALSRTTAALAAEAMDRACAAGVVVSYDVNYRASLWRGQGGPERARAVNVELMAKADLLFGVELERSDEAGYKRQLQRIAAEHPNLKLIAATLRRVHSASRNGWGAVALAGDEFIMLPEREVEILDRVGGGDAFAAGVIFGRLTGRDLLWSLRCGLAHGALAMTTPGDNSMATLSEVERAMDEDQKDIAR